MSENSTREDIEQDLSEVKNGVDAITKPIKDKVKDEISNDIRDRIGKQIADAAAKQTSNAAANAATSTTAGTTAGTAAGTTAGTTAGATAGTTAGASASGAAAGTAAGTTAGATAGATAGGAAAGAGTTVAGAAGAGAAGGPIGIAIGAIVGIVTAAGGVIAKQTSVSIDSENPNAPKINVIFIILAMLMFLLLFCGTLLSKGMASAFSISQETEFQESVVNGVDMSEAGKQFKENSTLKEFNDEKPLSNGIVNYVYGTDGTGTTDGIRVSIHKAITEHCHSFIKQIDKFWGMRINGHKYDSERSLTIFYENRWPYDLATADFTPKIGNVMQPADYEYEPYKPRYDDVNFAEIITVLCMSSSVEGATYGFDWGNLNYKDFMEYLQKEECQSLMYELEVKWVPVYHGTRYVQKEDGTTEAVEFTVEPYTYDSREACAEAEKTITYDGIECKWEEYYISSKVMPFGLRELYAMAFGTDNPTEASMKKHVNFHMHDNLYMLNYSERVARLYQREHKMIIAGNEVDSLGPSYKETRSIYSPVYSYVINDAWLTSMGWEGTGRSAWCYIENTYNVKLGSNSWVDSGPPDYDGDTDPDDLEDDLGRLSKKEEDALKELFPDGIPTTEEEMQQYLVTVEIDYISKDGVRGKKNITIHKALVENVQGLFKELADMGFRAYDIGTYNWRNMVTDGSKRSHHSYGVAIDINPAENPLVANGQTSSAYNPEANPYTTLTSVHGAIMNKYGFVWGGDWKSKKDYMHLSYTGY